MLRYRCAALCPAVPCLQVGGEGDEHAVALQVGGAALEGIVPRLNLRPAGMVAWFNARQMGGVGWEQQVGQVRSEGVWRGVKIPSRQGAGKGPSRGHLCVRCCPAAPAAQRPHLKNLSRERGWR